MHRTSASLCLAQTPQDVELLELVKPCKHTGPRNSTENIGTGPLHEGHGPLVSHDLDGTVPGALVLDSLAGGHHHASSDRVNGVRDETSTDCDDVAEDKRDCNTSVLPQEDRLEGVVEAEVAASVDNDTDARDDETSIQSNKAVCLEGLGVDIDEAIELPLPGPLAGCLGVISKPGSSIVEGVDEAEREGTSSSSRGNVLREGQGIAVLLAALENSLNLVLEGEVESLCGEVPEAVGQVASPEWEDTWEGEGRRRERERKRGMGEEGERKGEIEGEG